MSQYTQVAVPAELKRKAIPVSDERSLRSLLTSMEKSSGKTTCEQVPWRSVLVGSVVAGAVALAAAVGGDAACCGGEREEYLSNIREVLDEVDTNNDGDISYEELEAFEYTTETEYYEVEKGTDLEGIEALEAKLREAKAEYFKAALEAAKEADTFDEYSSSDLELQLMTGYQSGGGGQHSTYNLLSMGNVVEDGQSVTDEYELTAEEINVWFDNFRSYKYTEEQVELLRENMEDNKSYHFDQLE